MSFRKNIYKLLLLTAIYVFSFSISLAQSPALGTVKEDLKNTATNIGYTANENITINDVVIKVANYIFTLLGIIFLVLVVISGVQWLTSQGKTEVTKVAKSRIQNAVIGLAIVFFAYIITNNLFPIIMGIFKKSI